MKERGGQLESDKDIGLKLGPIGECYYPNAICDRQQKARIPENKVIQQECVAIARIKLALSKSDHYRRNPCRLVCNSSLSLLSPLRELIQPDQKKA